MPVVARRLDVGLGHIARFLRSRGLFTIVDPFVEQRRIDLIRVVVGSLAVRSFGRDVVGAFGSDDPTLLLLQGVAFVLSTCVLVGFATPVASLLLAFLLNLIIDNLSRSSNLGSMVFTMVLTAFAFMPAGRSLSIDARLLRARGPVGEATGRLYDAWGPLTADRAAIVKGGVFAAYAIIGVYAALLHVRDFEWTSGYVNTWLLLSRRTNPTAFESFQQLYAASPVLYILITRFSTFATLLWELGMAPLALLGRWPRFFVVAWGYNFCLIGSLLLPLRMLGWFEASVWTIIFWNSWKLNADGRDRIVVRSDARHRRLVGALRAVDVFRVIQVDERDAWSREAAKRGQVPEAVASGFAGLDASGRLLVGYDLLRVLAGRILLLLPFWPLLSIGRLGGIGPRMYRRLFDDTASPGSTPEGAATVVPSGIAPRPHAGMAGTASPASGSALLRAFVLCMVVLLAAFALRLPPVSEASGFERASALSKALVGQAPLVFGIGPVDVFNGIQLKTMRHAVYGWWAGGPTRFADLQAVLPYLTTSDIYENNRHLVYMAAGQRLCGGDEYNRFVAGLARRYAGYAVPAGYAGPLSFHVAYIHYDRPLTAELREYRYVELRDLWVCELTVDVATGAATAPRFTDDAARLYQRQYGLPFPISAAAIPRLEKFPCRAEYGRLAAWFDRANVVPRAPEAVGRLRALGSELEYKAPGVCFVEAENVLQTMDLDWREDYPPPDGAPCDPDLKLVDAYAEVLIGDPVGRVVEPFVAQARLAHEQGNHQSCSLLVTHVRRIYVNSLRAT